MSTYIFAVAAVPADASYAAVDHLDAAEHQLHHPHGQQYGEQNHMPHHGIGGVFTHCPHGLVYKVAAITAAREKSRRA